MSKLRLYNSLTRRIDSFKPRENKKVKMFVCGPTVYDYIHIGNARTFTIFDVIAKWLRHIGYDVQYIQNITDIDDQIIRRSAEKGKNPLEYALEYDRIFREDMKALGNDAVSEYARATDHIPQVIAQVKVLIAKGHAYKIDGDGWYFDLSTFPDYGKLSGRTAAAADDSVSRIDDSSKKRNIGDFCIWKFSKDHEPSWPDDELGAGRPGWHIEDTAITEHFFGPQYDLHGGGMDLKFPHHEAEIAQQESASGKKPFVKYWMHAGFLETSKAKMSKSLGNFLTLHEALEQYEPAVLRFYLLSNHYRAPLDFSDDSLKSAQAAVQRIGELARKKGDTKLPFQSAVQAITEAMDDDFNTPKAFAAIFSFIKEANAQQAVPENGFFDMVSDIFGIVPAPESDIPMDIQTLVDKRQTTRDTKDWKTSDALRDELAELGYSVDDTTYGPLIKKSK